ncbi:MAG: hypothetical protein ABI954_06995 [Pyrinomonadaceae bacterium]
MKLWKWLSLGGGLAAILAAVWIVWQRPLPIDMATDVPAETLCYFEADNLPKILQSLTNTEAWRELAPVNGVEKDLSNFGWLSQTLADASLGSTETLTFGRAQIAVALMGIGTVDRGASLKIRPQFAVVIETKSSRANNFVDTSVSDFARRQFGEIRIEKKETDGAAWTIFRAHADERNLFAAVAGTTIVVGNDEQAVQACLDAKSGKRKSLADDPVLVKMRASTERETAFAFGFLTTEGIKQLSSVGAVLVAGQMAEDHRAMSLLAQSLPPFVQKSVTAIGWTARKGLGDKIEDRYFVQMPPELVARLREPLAVQERNDSPPAAAFLPANLQSVTIYNLKSPQAAWRGVLFAMTTRLDAFSAVAFSQAANGLLAPYGVEKADDFLGATNGALSTARLSTAEDATVAAVRVRDAESLKKTLLVNGDKKSDLAEDFLFLGSEESLQICRTAREQNQTLQTQPIWLQFNEPKQISSGTFIRTLTRDDVSPIEFVKLFSKDKNQSGTAALQAGDKVPDWFWTISETRLVRDGVERRNTSPFGLIGTLATSFAEK